MSRWTSLPPDAARGLAPAGIVGFLRAGFAGGYPVHLKRGQGARVWDIDGRVFIDWVSGKGAVTLGHGHPGITQAVSERLASGVLLPGCPEDYELAAEGLAALVPEAERVIFAKNGSDAVHIALRLARVATGRDLVLSAGYHGWDDRLLPGAAPSQARGAVVDFGYCLERLAIQLGESSGRVAAILVTPEPGFLEASWLAQCRRLAREAGALFCVDEVRCGMRLAPGGAHQLFDVEADLTVLSKGLANGLPLSAVLGRRAVLDASADTFVFGTYYAEAASLAAARVVFAEYASSDVMGTLSRRGAQLLQLLEDGFERFGIVAHGIGPAPMPQLLFDDETDELAFYDGFARSGVLFFQDDGQCPSAALTDEDVEATRQACDRVLPSLPGRGRSRAAGPTRATLDRYAARRMIAAGVARLPRAFT